MEANHYSTSTVNLASPSQVAHILYDVLKLAPPCFLLAHPKTNYSGKKSKKTKAKSTSEAVLKELAALHPFPTLVLEHRHCQKMLSNWIEPLENKARGSVCKQEVRINVFQSSVGWRLYTQWSSTATGTGRLASSHPVFKS